MMSNVRGNNGLHQHMTIWVFALFFACLNAGCASRSFRFVDTDTSISGLRDSMTVDDAVEVISSSILDYRGKSYLDISEDYSYSGRVPWWSETAVVKNKHYAVTASQIQFSYRYEEQPETTSRDIGYTMVGDRTSRQVMVRHTRYSPRDVINILYFNDIIRIGTWTEGDKYGVFLVPRNVNEPLPRKAATRCWTLTVKKENMPKFVAAVQKLCPNLETK